MFFELSKILWFLANPGNLLLIALVAGAALLATRWRRAGGRLLAVVAIAATVIAVVPVGQWMIGALEDRFPATAEPPRVDGIVVLGGVIDPVMSRARGRIAIGSGAERLFEAAALARRYPRAKLIFSGGSGRLMHPDDKEAPLAAPLLARLGVEPGRVAFEDQARNTAENAELSLRLAQPKSGEVWLLVTSAFHMPRAVGCFRRVGWNVVPYPVNYLTAGESVSPLRFDFGAGLLALTAATHEYLGLLFYWATDRTDTLMPGPR